jgi:predicted phosphodiesterase
MAPRDAEVFSVGVDEVVVTFSTEDTNPVSTRVGDQETTTIGPHHVVQVAGLEPATAYAVAVEGLEPTEWLPAEVTTLTRPSGRLLATVATANDVHFGETECGRVGDVLESEVGPIFRSELGDPPYPEVMNAAVIAEMQELDPDVVIVKGDLTNLGAPDEYEAFLAAYGQLGERMHHFRGNHDAMLDPDMVRERAPYAIEAPGVTLAVLDTVRPGIDRGRLTADQIEWLDELAGSVTTPVLTFGHHHLWNLEAPDRSPTYFGIDPDDSEALADVVARRENISGYFAGHTHRNRVRRFERARNVPFVEVACTKDYPGAWGEYRIYEGGYTQVVRRASSPAALDWTERTRAMFLGLYHDYALGPLDDRCFTQTW